MSKLIVIEGTDCSGKETQTKKLVEHLEKDNKKVFRFSFPNYESPTGKIVGGPYLGKKSICNTWFKDSANLDPKIASLYYAADRRYNIKIIKEYINKGYIVILDRYVTSNMAHQGCKLNTKEERLKLFKWVEILEYELLELPKPDITIFLHMPVKFIEKLKENRDEIDAHESNKKYLLNAEKTYLELANIYNYKTIECTKEGKIRSIEEIHREIYDYINKKVD